MLELSGLVVLFAAAGFAQRGDDAEFWLPIAFGAVAIIAYAGFADVAVKLMSANS